MNLEALLPCSKVTRLWTLSEATSNHSTSSHNFCTEKENIRITWYWGAFM